jgi:hypothetical protein
MKYSKVFWFFFSKNNYFLPFVVSLSAHAATLSVGPGKHYANPSAAIAEAEPGDTVSIYPGQYYDCAIIGVPRLTVQGIGDAASVVLTDKTCGEKAILVIDKPGVTVRNLTLTRARVPDQNGAGIRMEGGSLNVDGVRFINNQDGILAGGGPGWELTVTNSLFERNGACRNDCAHGLYAGDIALLRVTHSVFRATKEAHHIKSRALRTEITDNTIEDGPNGTASYLIEAPNGGDVIIHNNTMEKGPNASNRTAAIVIGAESTSKPTPEIIVSDNDFTNDMATRTVFVKNLTATEAQLKGNKLHGKVQALEGDGSVN